MKNIKVITDTNASLPSELIEKFGIIQIPINIQFAEETFVTGVSIDDAELFRLIDERQVIPTTAAPSPSAFEGAYQKAFDQGAEHIICICCSGAVSATYNAACLAKEKFPEADISVVDSQQLSLAEGFQVLSAVEDIAEGKELDEIFSGIDSIRNRMVVYGALPTLKYLAMGGRMGKLAAGFGETLEIKPVLTLRDGKLDLLEKVRTWKKAKARLIQLASESAQGFEIERVGLIHVNNEEGVLALYEDLKAALDINLEPILAEFTPGLSVHTGSGVIAFALVLGQEK
ncbi:MAG: DegV family protein [Brevefilum sp.]|nr:DegV family protein [Brevefilum sp.]MDW7755467.1 DegV family protein [Brevefilum sp.]